ncbi:MAG: hypothetical protein KGZ30_00150 [Anaplasmataceae bacterium]|nr:hypothetical protein [Anaplasmataceae bacterium]
MELNGRALYNILRGNWLENPSLDLKAWQVEDYRALSEEELWKRLKSLGLLLDRSALIAYAQECDGPEELTELLVNGEQGEEIWEHAYLILFEFWRRELPDRQTLSIFCDELDFLMDFYDRGTLEDRVALEEALDDLEKILDESVDAGLQPKEAFALIGQFSAHDVESFLYDYLAERISAGQELTASEWIDGFYDYVQDVRWFDFLRARLFARANVEESNDILARLVESLQEKPDLDLSLEIATFLVREGDPLLFKQVILQCLDSIKTEEDFQDLLAIVANYHRCLDQEKEEQAIESLFERRSHRQLDLPFDRNDQDARKVIDNLKM